MRSLIKYLSDYRKECVLSPLFKLLEASFELIVPLVVASLIDRGISEGDTSHIIKMGLLLILLGAAGLIFSLTAQFFAAKAATGFSSKLRSVLFDRIQEMDFPTLDRIGTDTFITRMTADVAQIQNGLNMFLRLLLRSPFIVFGAMIMAFTVDHQAALVFVVLIICLSLVVILIMKVTRLAYRKIQGYLDRVTGKVRENLTGVRVIRAFNREEAETEEFGEINLVLSSGQEAVGKISALMNPLTFVLVNLFTAALIYTGAVRVDIGLLTRGSVVALLNYMAQILVELIKLANLVILVSKSIASADRAAEILDMEIPCDRGDKPFPEDNRDLPFISFNGVSLKYGGNAEKSLEDIDFSVKRHETIGIIGGTGSGKSSLVNMIPAFYEATEGQILINGVDIRDIEKKSLREKIGIVPQKCELFRGTVAENLRWGNENADEKELWEALRTAQAEDFIREKPGQLEFMVEQGGRNLSGGQKQRLTIARALLKKPEILILDDSASALDFATDARLRRAIREISEDITLILVSQRAASVRDADLIIVLDDGCMAGSGTHEELLADNEVYREIYHSQFPEDEEAV